MTSQQKKAFEYIISVADGYGRTLPVKTLPESEKPFTISNYNRIYKDIRENNYNDWDGWEILFDIVKIYHDETEVWGRTWNYLELTRSVYRKYQEIWKTELVKNNKECFPSEYNIDIQMFDAYLLSPNCFLTVCNAINNGTSRDVEAAGQKCYSDVSKYNNFIKSAKIAFIQKISLPEWNTENSFHKIKKDKWYDRINQINQL